MDDFGRIPLTDDGWEEWTRQADGMLESVRPFFSQNHAKLVLPGPVGSSGVDSDGLEGFARTFLLAGFRLAGMAGKDPLGLIDWYRQGLIAGTDPFNPEAWPRLDTLAQAKVEAASIALVLDLTRPWLWETLTQNERKRVIAWFAPVIGDSTYPRNNWVWFRIVVETFLRSVGGPWSEADIREDLAFHDSCYRGDGWYSDGHERAFDYYVGWAMHLYPTLWGRMAGAEEFVAERRGVDAQRLSRFLEDYAFLEGADGAPVFQGRSLIYRFAAAAPYWVGLLAGVGTLEAGVVRRATTGMLRYFRSHGAPNRDGLLDLGWQGFWPRLAQSYSGSSSPYWASKGMLGLVLGPDHPVWSASELPLPVESGDHLRVIRPAGWIVSTTQNDGIVRVINHGTDHASVGTRVADSPIYTRLGYSTVTTPVMDEDAERNPVDQSVVLLDGKGRATHRAGMSVRNLRIESGVGVGSSDAAVHWVEPAPVQKHHGSGLEGEAREAGHLSIVSLVRGPWEIRAFSVDNPVADATSLRVGGWALSGDDVHCEIEAAAVRLQSGELTSMLLPLQAGTVSGGVMDRPDASPLPGPVVAPFLTFPVDEGWRAVGVLLDGTGEPRSAPHLRELRQEGRTLFVEVEWGDHTATQHEIPIGEASGSDDSHHQMSRSNEVPCEKQGEEG